MAFNHIRLIILGATALLSLPSCNGIFDDLYDDPAANTEQDYGFIARDETTHSGSIYIDATLYTEWHYVDLHNQQVTTLTVNDEPPAHWDFALHRYDTKTNGGAVWESSVNEFTALPAPEEISAESFVPDEWTTERISIDMSQMMDGVILYAEDYYNPCLSRWLDVNTSTMPPIYTLSGKAYLLRLSDGTYAALRLTNFMNDAAVKGYMTIDYQYPFER